MGIAKTGLVILMIILTGFTKIYAQDVKAIIKSGDVLFKNEDYFKAANYYERALEREPQNVIVKYRLAETYRLMTDHRSAESYYGEVLRRSESNFPLARYYYALTQKFNGKYKEALGNFELFLKNIEAKRYARLKGNVVITFSEQARIELEGCLLALEELSNNRIEHNFHLLDEPVNTSFNDYAAYTYHHDSTIVITSARLESKGSHVDHRFGEALTDLFRFEFVDGKWAPITSLDRFDKEVNSKFHDGSGVFNRDFTKFYFTHCAPDTGCEIHLTQFVDGKWTEPTPLNSNVNMPRSDSMHPALTSNGDTLFFASDRIGGLGDFDIWMSVSKRGEAWGRAQNLGDYINTAFREISPFYDNNGSTLFFASDGHLGHGGLDILMGENIFNTNTEVFNMGLPYNSSSDDAFFLLGESGGYLSSNRQGGKGNFDIYTFQIDSDVEIITEVINSKQLASRNSIFVTDYKFDNPDIKKIEAVVSNLLASRIHSTNLPFSQDQQVFYKGLSEADKIRIERIVNSRMKSTGRASLQTIRHEDEFFYQQIAGDFKYYVDRMVTYYIEDYNFGDVVEIPAEDKAFYEELNSNSKSSIDRFIALKLNEYDNLDLNDEYYLSAPDTAQQRIDNISDSYLKAKANLSSIDLIEADMNFLSGLDEEDRQRSELSIANQVATLSSKDEYELDDVDRNFYQKLSEPERTSIDNMAQAYIQASVNNLEEYLDPEDLSYFNSLNTRQKSTFDKLLAKRIQNFVKADKYTLDALPSEEILRIVDLTITKTDIEKLSEDSAFLDNSVLKEMVKEDQKRFSRLLASATNFIMIKSADRLRDAALIAEKRQDIIQLVRESNEETSPLLRTEVTNYQASLDPELKKVFEDIVAGKTLEVITQVGPNANANSGNMVIPDEMLPTFSPANLISSHPNYTSVTRLNDDDQREFSAMLVDATNQLLRQKRDNLSAIVRKSSVGTSMLVSLKESSTAEESTINQEVDPIGPDVAALVSTNITIGESDGENVIPSQAAEGISREAAQSIARMVNSSKRSFGQNLSDNDLQLYTSLNPADKRFIDQALNQRIQQYVSQGNPILQETDVSTTSGDGEVPFNLLNDFRIARFNANPEMRRSMSSVLRKSAADREEIEKLMAVTAGVVITQNQPELALLAKEANSEGVNIVANSQDESSSIDLDSQSETTADPNLVKIRGWVTEVKPEFVRAFSAPEMQQYMSLSADEKAFIEDKVAGTLNGYVSQGVVSTDGNVDASLSQIYQNKLNTDFDLTRMAKDDSSSEAASLLNKSADEQKQISLITLKMASLVLDNKSSELKSISPSVQSESISDIISQPTISQRLTNSLSANQMAVYEGMSSEEKQFLSEFLAEIETNPADDEIMAESLPEPTINSLGSGQWQGQVVTIQVVESDDLSAESLDGEVSLLPMDSLKVGETVRLIWSQKDKIWYQLKND